MFTMTTPLYNKKIHSMNNTGAQNFTKTTLPEFLVTSSKFSGVRTLTLETGVFTAAFVPIY